MKGGLRLATVRGISWTGLAQGTGYLVTVGALGLAARYLRPRDFGAEAAVAVVVGVWVIAADLGLGRALVQRRDLTPSHLAAALWIGLITSCFSAVLLWQTARFWSRLFFDDQVATILPTMGWGLVCAGVGAVPRAQMERAFRFGQLAVIDLCASLLGGGTLVALALLDYGVWSLVWGYVVRSGVLGVGPWMFCPAVGRYRFVLQDAKDLLGFGTKWVGSRLVGYAQQNVDYLLIGRLLGSGALGYYSLAYRLIAFPQVRLVQAVSRVTFPAFSALQTDLPRLRGAYLSTITYIALLVFPIMAGFYVLADPVIVLVYGEGKALAGGILQLLWPAGAVRAVASPVGLIFSSLGRTGLALIWNIGAALFMLGAVRAGVVGGVEGVALAVSLGAVALAGVSQAIVNRIVALRFGDYLRALRPAAVCSAVMVGGVGFHRWLLAGQLPDLALVATCVVLGGCVYLLALRLLARETSREALDLARLLWKRAEE